MVAVGERSVVTGAIETLVRNRERTVFIIDEPSGQRHSERAAIALATAPPKAIPTMPTPTHPSGTWLPCALTTLVGRSAELATIIGLLNNGAVRLVTLTGPGGSGKTRLAIEAASELRPEFGSILLVELAHVRDPELVVPAIGQALGLPDTGESSLIERIAEHIGLAHSLLILDNFEQVVTAAPIIPKLIASCPGLTILVTSREVLRLYGEHEYVVPPLALPEGGVKDFDRIAETEAVQLFVNRATAVRRDFILDATNVEAVAALCTRLDGSPLAIELAASRLRHLSPQALLARLDSSLSLLTLGSRDLPPRLQSMRNAIAWSHDLLSPAEQALFRRLAVFAAGFTADAAERVAGIEAAGDDSRSQLRSSFADDSIFDGITSLIDKSLVTTIAGTDGEPRYRMLETIREFGVEQLEASGDAAEIRRRHAEWCVEIAEHAAAGFTGPNRVTFARRLDREQANFRQAFIWFEETGNASMMLRLVAALAPYWEMQGSLRQGEVWASRSLAMADAALSPWYGRALQGASAIAYRRGKYEAAVSRANAALRIAETTGNADLAAGATLLLGNVAFDHGDLETALEHYRFGGAKYRETKNEEGIADARAKQGLVLAGLGDLDAAATALGEALEIGRRLNRPIWVATAIGRLSFVDQLRGDLESAEQRVTEILPVQRLLNPITAVATLWCGATVARDARNYPLAASRYRESLELRWQWGERRGVSEAVAGIAELAVLAGQLEAGARLFGGVETMRAIVGVPGYRWEQSRRDQALSSARQQLGPRVFDQAYTAGLSMSREESVRLAMELADQIEYPELLPVDVVVESPEQSDLPNLTTRELEVLRSLALGLSDREIGNMLFISPRTVARHLHSIYQKLDVSSRSGATAFAHRNGLIEPQA